MTTHRLTPQGKLVAEHDTPTLSPAAQLLKEYRRDMRGFSEYVCDSTSCTSGAPCPRCLREARYKADLRALAQEQDQHDEEAENAVPSWKRDDEARTAEKLAARDAAAQAAANRVSVTVYADDVPGVGTVDIYLTLPDESLRLRAREELTVLLRAIESHRSMPADSGTARMVRHEIENALKQLRALGAVRDGGELPRAPEWNTSQGIGTSFAVIS